MPIDVRRILDASLALNLLAKSYEGDGQTDYANELFQVAADLELASLELQNCWGGPFNGQAGRQAIMLDLLRLLEPAAVIETGTFRGISVEWIARHYSGPIFSCEKEKLYFLQSQARLSGYPNVELHLEDSRRFLRHILKRLATDRPAIVYLDAHWGHDLPLRDELQIVFASQPKAVVVIDDFRVPDDPGYGWDDYGPHGSIELELLDGVIPCEAQLFFPILNSSEDTGARRGCCIVAGESASIVAQSALLRGDTLASWMENQRAASKSIQDKPLIAMVKQPEVAAAAWLEQWNKLQADLADPKGRRDTLLERVADLAVRAASHDQLIATLEMPDAPRSLKIVLPLARMFRKLRVGVQKLPFGFRW